MNCSEIGEMGNEESLYRKMEIEDEAIEVTDNWSLRQVKDVDGKGNIHSAFVGEPKTSERADSLLEKFAKNLKIHRHPSILKYITSWYQSNRFFLVTEKVQPLPLVITNQSPLEICMGLYNVLNALIFLHEKAKSSHNNICCASIYVTPEGIWKLGGLQYLKKFSEITKNYLEKSRNFRYEKAISPEEDSFSLKGDKSVEAIDKYAFGVLVEELLKKKTDAELGSITEFKEFCKKRLIEPKPEERAELKLVLSHLFFDHDFIRISKFLLDLPLKSSCEKQQFFRDLTEQLNFLPEKVVASQLASPLLSRVVLLDQTAQKHLLPALLRPKEEQENHCNQALFSSNIFKKYIIPKLLQIMCVRDAQIRLILLDHFHLFCDSFTIEELKLQVLPELLVGIKDLDDKLVSKTLKALSLLVMILGATTVIGGKRAKLFTDGRPKSEISTSIVHGKMKGNKGSPSKTDPDTAFEGHNLPERLSPDGGEDASASGAIDEVEAEPESWSDWDPPANEEPANQRIPEVEEKLLSGDDKNKSVFRDTNRFDISSLDIKSGADEDQSFSKDVDFFRDMEPVISKTQVLRVISARTKFDVESVDGENWEGWGNDCELGEVP